MEKWKIWQISLFTVLCILLNCAGRVIGKLLSLPLWLDSFGTVFCAYVGGPFCGAVTGAASNLLYGSANHISHVYALTSICLGVIVGLMARRGAFRDLFGTMSVAGLSALFSVLISAPLNILYYGGRTGNLWGNGVYDFLRELSVPGVLCSVAGEFAIDFADKFLTLLLLFGAIVVRRRIVRMREDRRQLEEERQPGHTAVYSESGLHDAGFDAESVALHAHDHSNFTGRHDGSHSGASPKAAGAGGAPAKSAVQEDVKKTAARLILAAIILPAALVLPVPADAADGDAPSFDVVYNDYVQTVYDSKNGIPCGVANDIAQTNDGILWIGTYAGLYRYNGSEFRWMDEYESVRNVNCLFVDREGRLWIGTNDNGLSISINEEIVNVLDEDDGLPSNTVRCVTQGADGYYYVGTEKSMQVLELGSGLRRKGTFAEVSEVRSMSADQAGHVAAATSGGRLFLLKGGQILSSLRLTSSDETFNCCGFMPDGRLMAGTTANRIYFYDISRDYFVEDGRAVECGDLRSLNDFQPLENGEILVCADNGIGLLDPSLNFHRIKVNSFNNSVDSIQVDYQGNFWFASSRQGLLRLARSPFRDIYGSAGIEPHVANAVTKWQGCYYFGTDSGLDIVDEKGREALTTPLSDELNGVRIRCLYAEGGAEKGEDGTLWICTYSQGLLAVKPDGSIRSFNAKNSILGNKARLLRRLSNGLIAASGNDGLILLQDGEIVKSFPYSDDGIGTTILTIEELEDGTVLVGTDGEGISVIRNDEIVRQIRRGKGLSSDVILRIIRDRGGDGAFIVTSNGLCYIDRDSSVKTLPSFPYFNNYDIWMKNEDTLFVTGSSGIYIVDRGELLSGSGNLQYDFLDRRKGLESALTANSWCYDDGEGNLYLPCDRGVYELDTDQYRLDARSYRMKVSNVILDGAVRGVERSSPIVVGRGISRIEFHPEIINYSIQDPLVGYYLEGFEENWHILPRSSLGDITYTNLAGGSYTLRLAVFDSDQSTILEEQTYSVIKEKEIYDNLWFRLYMLFILLSFVAWLTWFIVRTQVQRTMEIQRRELELARQQVQMGNETIAAIANTVDAKDVRTSQHSYRVSEYSYLIGKELGMSEEECRNLRNAARMHDIGKIGVPDNILNKPARLTDEEYQIMKSHTLIGAEILHDFTLLDNVIDGALYHHERYDGRGYPTGLRGEEIPYYGRIIGVADAFDAMTANRVYRRQMDFGYVLNEMKKGRGTQFDPHIVDVFLLLIENGTIDLEKLYPEIREQKEEEK